MPLTEPEALVAAEILRIVREDLHVEEHPAPDEPLAGRLDSIALLSLVVAVEDRFHVILTDDDAAVTRTLEDLARLVAARAPEDRLPRSPPPASPPSPPRSGASAGSPPSAPDSGGSAGSPPSPPHSGGSAGPSPSPPRSGGEGRGEGAP